ncbi:ribonuclease III [Candidatus Epulonipiscioides saccharophilum]|nr:ribonuclease III [Epulopiscium sp. SCG-B10WGA-EpuloB]
MSLSNERLEILQKFEQLIDYKYKNISLLDLALTHSSYANEHRDKGVKDNERLEFLGDAILDLIVSEYLFNKYPGSQEGDLSKFRASIVCEESLGKTGKKMNFGDYILLGHGEELGGGRERESILADALEAVTGAMLLDSSYENVKKFITKILIEPIKDTAAVKLYKDYKTILQVESQKLHDVAISYEVVDEVGPDHDKEFTVELRQNGQAFGRGVGRTKRDAEQMAAHQALINHYHYKQ